MNMGLVCFIMPIFTLPTDYLRNPIRTGYGQIFQCRQNLIKQKTFQQSLLLLPPPADEFLVMYP